MLDRVCPIVYAPHCSMGPLGNARRFSASHRLPIR